MLYTQTLEKLRALRLEGMVQALEEQRQQKDIVRLDFEERLALLVERQWIWKENRGFALRLKNAQLKISNATLEDLDYRPSRGLKRAQIDQLRASQSVGRVMRTALRPHRPQVRRPPLLGKLGEGRGANIGGEAPSRMRASRISVPPTKRRSRRRTSSTTSMACSTRRSIARASPAT
jgi:hypothetical protein